MKQLFITIVRIIPIMQMMGILFVNMLYYFNIFVKIANIFNYIFGNSLSVTILLYVISYLFGYCSWHRAIMLCNLINITITTYDRIIGIPISNFEILILYFSLFIIFMLFALYLKFKTKCYEKCNEIVSKRIKECCGQD